MSSPVSSSERAITPTGELLRRARVGDRPALDRIFARHFPKLYRWARGRLPRWARGIADTADVVQEAMLGTLNNLQGFEPVRADVLQGYLRKAVENRIKDECRRARRLPPTSDVAEVDIATPASNSPYEAAASGELEAQVSDALLKLRPSEREAVVARFDLGYSYEQIAFLLRKRSPDAARMFVNRAVLHLAEELRSAQQ